MISNGQSDKTTAEQLLQQKQIEDAYEDQRYFNRKNADASLQAQKEIAVYTAKQQIKEQYAIQREEQKQWRKQYDAELAKNKYDEISLTAEGNITATVCNLYENPTARIITNMRNPKLDRLIHLEQPTDFVYALTADLGNNRGFVYLDRTKIGNANYLIRKFTARGIYFYSDSSAQQKEYARILICFLQTQKLVITYIPENPGWAYFPDDGFKFIEKEEMTWKKIMNLIK